MKRCTKCLYLRPVADFGLAKNRKDSLSCHCRECVSYARDPKVADKRMTAFIYAALRMKSCNVCKQIKSIEDFHIRRMSHDGRAFTCASCIKESLARRRKADPTEFKRWYANNRDHRSRYWRDWYAKNVDKRAVSYSRWAKENKHIVNAIVAKRIAAKKQATVSWADASAIRAIYAEAARLTAETGIRHEVDHIIPLQSDVVCGLHWEGNLQVLTKTENLRKKNRLLESA